MEDQPALSPDLAPPASADGGAYRVLARKYRPTTFAELIGQDAMVRTLRNAIAQNRVAHAFLLTGVRGIGKTTTARLIARGLNCIGPDGDGGPTIEPCGVCEHCRAIAEDRHVDVIELDAASRTGVGEMRELIDGVRYRPVSARFKIYIIDEVHMLSTAAFNALLKTLEEPPEHVKFIFATTEVRKLPVTVLSRCQRFDLRRIDLAGLAAHLAEVAAKEGASLSDGAARLLARAADGSVRDGLSLLDQAIAMAEGATVEEAPVRDMLGLADRTRVLDLSEAALRGDAAACLAQLGDMYRAGADPAVALGDMLELVHLLTRMKVNPAAAADPMMAEAERVRGAEMAQRLGMGQLARAWQMLLKGLAETQQAPNPLQAAEMALIRLCYAAELPTPAQVIDRLEGAAGATPAETPSAGPAPSDPPGVAHAGGGLPGPGGAATARAQPLPVEAPSPLAPPAPEAEAKADPRTFDEVVALFEARREGVLCAQLKAHVHLVRCEPGRLEFRPSADAPEALARDVKLRLEAWTGRAWAVALSSEPGAPTLVEQERAEADALRARVAADPRVQAVLTAFPGAEIADIRPLAGAAAAPDGDGPSEPGLPDPDREGDDEAGEYTLDDGDVEDREA